MPRDAAVTRFRITASVVALLFGLLAGAAGAHTAYWVDACVARETNGYGMSPDWLNRCRK